MFEFPILNILLRILVIVLGSINGGYMLFDGIYEMINGHYYGPEKPGPWADVLQNVGIDIYILGPVFIFWGLGWLYFVVLLWIRQSRAFIVGLITCLLTLWYLPVGTFISVIVFCLLMSNKKPSGLLYSSKYH